MKEGNIDLVKSTMLCGFSKPRTDVCLVDKATRYGLYTICGEYIDESDDISDRDFFIVYERFKGKLEDVTCPNCLKIIEYIKSLN